MVYGLVSSVPALPGAAGAVAAAALAAFALPQNSPQGEKGKNGDESQHKIIPARHSRPPTLYIKKAASHATAHCTSTTPTVAQREPSSRRMVATAATQGV